MCVGMSWGILFQRRKLASNYYNLKTIYLHLTGQVQFEQYSASKKSKLKIKILD